MKGRRVEVLFTPSLYGVANRKGVKVFVADTNDSTQVMEAYIKVIYLAAINAREVRRFDDPNLEELDLTLMDFYEWASADQAAFVEMMKIAIEAFTGKNCDDKKDVKKK